MRWVGGWGGQGALSTGTGTTIAMMFPVNECCYCKVEIPIIYNLVELFLYLCHVYCNSNIPVEIGKFKYFADILPPHIFDLPWLCPEFCATNKTLAKR